MKTKFLFTILSFFVLNLAAFAQENPIAPGDPPELAGRRQEHERAVQRLLVPELNNYLRTLEPLRAQFTRERKLEAALAVENEIRKVTAELKATTTAASATAGARTGKTYVQLYVEENFKGNAIRAEGPADYPNFDKSPIPNDKLQSMKVPLGLTVTLFEGAGFGGRSQSYTGEIPSLGAMKGLASSMKIEAAKPR